MLHIQVTRSVVFGGIFISFFYEIFCSIIEISFQGNHMDIAPNYAGTMMGITNMIGNIAGFVTPYVTGAIIFENVRQHLLLSNHNRRDLIYVFIFSANACCLEDRLFTVRRNLRGVQRVLCPFWNNRSSALEFILGKSRRYACSKPLKT